MRQAHAINNQNSQQTQQVMEACTKCLFEALPKLPEDRLVDILEFVATQHSGRNFDPDNTAKALEVAAFLQRRPYPVSDAGVSAIARLARHALGSSTGSVDTPEHKLWLLTSGALNTAAAIHEHKGDAVVFFDAMQRDGSVRGRYLQRQYTTAAMKQHVQDPSAYLAFEDADERLIRKINELRPCQLALLAFMFMLVLFVGLAAGHQATQHAIMRVVAPNFGKDALPQREAVSIS